MTELREKIARSFHKRHMAMFEVLNHSWEAVSEGERVGMLAYADLALATVAEHEADLLADAEPAIPRVWRFNWRRFRFERGFRIYLRGTDGLDEWRFVADPPAPDAPESRSRTRTNDATADGEREMSDIDRLIAIEHDRQEDQFQKMTLEELAQETLTQKHRRLRQEQCCHEAIYRSSVTGPSGAFTTRFCDECGKSWHESIPSPRPCDGADGTEE